MKILQKIKSLSLVALAAIFFLSATLISCGDGKKDASSEDESTEGVMENDEMPMDDEMDSTHHEEGEHEEHPTEEGHEEHPAEEGHEEHPTEEEGGSEHPAN